MTRKTGRSVPFYAGLLATSVAVSACAPDGAYRAPTFPFLASYAGAGKGAPVLVANRAWWEGFKDPVLNRLVERALAGNLSLELARERVIEARAAAGLIGDEVSITSEAELTRQKALGGDAFTRREASLGLTWMLDPWGARRERARAARARIDASDAELDAARLLVLYNIANVYVDLRYQQRALIVRQQEAAARRQTLALTRTLLERNSATRLDVVAAEARLAETEATIPTLRAAVKAHQYQIAALLGMQPGTLDIDLGSGARQPRPTLSPQVGIPADLLRNRPDIRIAERLYYAALADLGAAEADLYPKLSLGGAITLASAGGAEGAEYVFGPALTLPALPGSDRKATVAVRDSRVRQALTTWKTTVLAGVVEVESALVDYAGSAQAVTASQRAVRLYRDAAELTRDLVNRDGATLRDLAVAEEEIADADLALAENLRRHARGFIEINVNLGAGHAVGTGAAQTQ